jgi:hypothetical protein
MQKRAASPPPVADGLLFTCLVTRRVFERCHKTGLCGNYLMNGYCKEDTCLSTLPLLSPLR